MALVEGALVSKARSSAALRVVPDLADLLRAAARGAGVALGQWFGVHGVASHIDALRSSMCERTPVTAGSLPWPARCHLS